MSLCFKNTYACQIIPPAGGFGLRSFYAVVDFFFFKYNINRTNEKIFSLFMLYRGLVLDQKSPFHPVSESRGDCMKRYKKEGQRGRRTAFFVSHIRLKRPFHNVI